MLFIDASAEFVRQGNKNKLTDDEPAEDPRRVHRARGRRPLRARSSTNDEIAENGYNIAVSSYVEAEDTREAVDITTLNAEIAQHRRAAGRAARRRSTRSSPTWKAALVSRIDDLIAQLCPDGVEFKTLGEVGELVRGNGTAEERLHGVEGVGAIHYGQIYTDYGTWTTDDDLVRVRPSRAAKLRQAQPGDVIIANDERERRGRRARPLPGSATTMLRSRTMRRRSALD